MDISVVDTGKYRKLVLTGEISRPSPVRATLERIYVGGLEITYVLMYFWTRAQEVVVYTGEGFETSGTTRPH